MSHVPVRNKHGAPNRVHSLALAPRQIQSSSHVPTIHPSRCEDRVRNAREEAGDVREGRSGGSVSRKITDKSRGGTQKSEIIWKGVSLSLVPWYRKPPESHPASGFGRDTAIRRGM